MNDLAENLQRIRQRIAKACAHAGRKPDDVTLVAVTKTVPPERVEEAIAAGQFIFGESRVQEARAKIPLVSSRARWQFIGHLQTNKARDAVELFELIHAVDSVKLAAELQKVAENLGRSSVPILLEINVAAEKSKFGFSPERVVAELPQILQFSRLDVQGLMTIAPFFGENVEKTRPFFAKLRQLRDELRQKFSVELPQISMGMTADFEIAIEEGATMVRIGTAIFGERPKE
jgi:pyridoxal phosphate enzyme (YggS family)